MIVFFNNKNISKIIVDIGEEVSIELNYNKLDKKYSNSSSENEEPRYMESSDDKVVTFNDRYLSEDCNKTVNENVLEIK